MKLALLGFLLVTALIAGCVQGKAGATAAANASIKAGSPSPAGATPTPKAAVQASAVGTEITTLLNDSEFLALNISALPA